LQAAQKLTVENDGIKPINLVGEITRAVVMEEIVRHLEPFQAGEQPITGATVISKDLTIDSLAVMDMVMELEDRFDISIPLNTVAEIHTVDELTDTILALRAAR
jgi:acyl carrier protein